MLLYQNKRDLNFLKRRNYYAYENNGRPCRGEYEYETDEYTDTEDAKEAREKAKTEQENAIQKRREQRKELEKRIAESRNGDTDAVSIGESGKAALDEKTDSVQTGADNGTSAEETADVIKMEPAIYTKAGEKAESEPGVNFSVSV